MVFLIKNNKIKQLYNLGAIHIILGTFVTKFVAFFGSIVVVRLLSKENYGLLSYVETIYSYAFIFAGIGLPYAVLRYLILAKTIEEKKSFFYFITYHDILRNAMIALILIYIGLFAPIPINYLQSRYLILIIAILLPFHDLLNICLYTIRSFFCNKIYALFALLSSSSLIVCRILGAYTENIAGILWSRIIINVVFSIICFVYIQKRFFYRVDKHRISKKDINNVNIYSFQYMITNGFWAIFMLNDTFMIGQLLNDPGGLAEYKVATILPGGISIVAIAIGIFVGPYFTKNEKNTKWIRINFFKIFTLTAIVIGIINLIIGIFARELIIFIYGEEYLNIITIMRILLVASFLNSGLRYTCANLLAAMGEIKYNMIVSGIGVIFQLIINMILIPKIGIIAVAISNCIIFTCMAITLFIIFVKKYF